jgi:rare lipoprotein A (peptidoglycan hydrolase)
MATKFWTAAAFLLIGLCASAQSFWDGNAALQRGDPSFEKGSFAASNSFPTGTKIVVENLETGKTAEVEVSRRSGEQSDLLVLLSPKAASALGIPAGQIAAVRVTLKSAETAQAEPAWRPRRRRSVSPKRSIPEPLKASPGPPFPNLPKAPPLKKSHQSRPRRLPPKKSFSNSSRPALRRSSFSFLPARTRSSSISHP